MKYSNEQLIEIIRPLPQAAWSADFRLLDIDKGLERLSDGAKGGINLQPEFQRGHVWTHGQQRAFCEGLIRRSIPSHLLTVQFNYPHWHSMVETDLPDEVQCVDGLQRITAIRQMLAGLVKPFGFVIGELEGTNFSLRRLTFTFKVCMHAFRTRRELLTYYIDINAGGTPHTTDELERVKSMLAETESEKSGVPSGIRTKMAAQNDSREHV